MASSHSSLFATSTCFQCIATSLVCVLLLVRVGAQDRRNEVEALLECKDTASGSFDTAMIFDDIQSGMLNEATPFERYWDTWNMSDFFSNNETIRDAFNKVFNKVMLKKTFRQPAYFSPASLVGLSGGPLPPIRPDSALDKPSFFQGNDGLCGDPKTGNWLVLFGSWLNKEKVYIIIGGLAILGIGSCPFAMWQWKVYNKRHQKDADLIKTLLERESITLMTLRDLKKATCNFAESAKIGEGGFGVVFVGRLSDGRQVAIKKGKPKGLDEIQFFNEFKSTFKANFGHVCLNWEKRVNIAIQTAEALNYVHSGAAFPIYHRDVKSANILLDEHFYVKVADLGISRLAPLDTTHVSTIAVKGTLGYIDPDYYTSYQLNDKSDIYSFDVVLLELISAKPAIDPLRGGDETSLVKFAKPYIQSGDLQQFMDGNLLQTYDDPTGHGKESILSLGRLALKCLKMQSKARPSMKEVLKELLDLRIELNGQSKDLGSTNELHNQDPQYEQIMSFVNTSSTSSSSCILQIGGTGIEMNQSSCLGV